VLLYWDIGQEILVRLEQAGWGSKVVDRLARNLKYMRAFAKAWPDLEIVQGRLAQMSWRHQIALLEKLDDPEMRLWYADSAPRRAGE
jgi:hypothetical protein